MEYALYYLATGAFAGLLAGLLGVGGGLIIVPVLAWLFARQGFEPGLLMHLALGTSLATIIATSIVSAWSHHRHGAVNWPVVMRLSPGIVAGALAGAMLVGRLDSILLQRLFGVFEILVAIQMLASLKPSAHSNLPGTAGMAGSGAVIGFISSIVGIGGGTLTVPFLLWCRVNMRMAVATSAACGLPIAVAGMAGYIYTGSGHAGLPAGSSGYVYWPAFAGIVACSVLLAPLGAMLAHRLPVNLLKKVFALLLCALGGRMLLF